MNTFFRMGLLLSLAACSTHSFSQSGNQLLVYAESNRDDLIKYMAGYMTGAAYQRHFTEMDARLYDDSRAGPPRRPVVGFCKPESATPTQAVDIVVKYLKAHPESRDMPHPSLTFFALSEVWPCAK
jgi:hypothetical protein